MEVEGSEQLAERVFGEECNVDVQLRQQVDKLLGLLGIGLRRKCPFGGLELTLPASLQRGQVAEAAPDLCACVSTLSGPPDPERIAEMAAPYGLTLLGPPLSRD